MSDESRRKAFGERAEEVAALGARGRVNLRITAEEAGKRPGTSDDIGWAEIDDDGNVVDWHSRSSGIKEGHDFWNDPKRR